MVWLEVMLFLNYKPVLDQPTGIGVYANAVLPALQSFDHVFVPGGGSGGSQQRLRRLAWSQFQLPRLARKSKADLIFTPAPEGYLGEQTVPQVVMVHDLRPLSHPEHSMQSVYFQSWVPPLLKQSSLVLTNSNFTASEIRRTIGLPQDKIRVTPLGFDSEHFYPSNVIEPCHDRPYFLHVGQPYPHKNIRRLLHAFVEIASEYPDIDLLLAGKSHDPETKRLKKQVNAYGIENRVKFVHYVSYAQLPDLYRGALGFVFPSLWEGFGLPILEAMACGTPVITSYGSATEEVAANNALLVNPYCSDQIYHSMKEILLKEGLRKKLIKNGLSHVSDFSWEHCKLATYNHLAPLLS